MPLKCLSQHSDQRYRYDCTVDRQRRLDSCGWLSRNGHIHYTFWMCRQGLLYGEAHPQGRPCTEERNGVARRTRRNGEHAETCVTVPRSFPECACHFIGRRFRNIQRHSQVEHSVAIEQVSLSLDGIQTGLLIGTETEWDKHTARDRQEGHGVNALEGHDPLIIDDSTLWPKRWFDALI